jgi:hypothetical protein
LLLLLSVGRTSCVLTLSVFCFPFARAESPGPLSVVTSSSASVKEDTGENSRSCTVSHGSLHTNGTGWQPSNQVPAVMLLTAIAEGSGPLRGPNWPWWEVEGGLGGGSCAVHVAGPGDGCWGRLSLPARARVMYGLPTAFVIPILGKCE